MILLHNADFRMAIQVAATSYYLNPISSPRRTRTAASAAIPAFSFSRRTFFRASLSSSSNSVSSSFSLSSSLASQIPSPLKGEKKPAVCTADELHYVDVPGSGWRIALWRYIPCPKAPPRNHPLVLLSGVGTNAIGFDLSPGASFARHMCAHGFDTWIVEVRGAGLSSRIEPNYKEQLSNNSVVPNFIKSTDQICQNGVLSENRGMDENASDANMQELKISSINGNKGEGIETLDEVQFAAKLTDTLFLFTERLSSYLSDSQLKILADKFIDQISKLLEEAGLSDRFNGIQERISALLEERQYSVASTQIRELSKRLVNLLNEGQRSVSPQFLDLQKQLSTTIEDFQKQLDLIVTYDWDFDHYLVEDIPAAMEYIKSHTQPKDGKLLAIGHSMGGILLYAMLSQSGFKGRDSQLAAVVTLASSLDYTSSKSSLKLLLPLADPAQALNVPVVPLGALMAAAYPLASRPPYVLSWLSPQISAQDMMHPELFEKLVLNNFCTIPAKLLLQLTTAFRDRGLRDRSGTFCYKEHLHKCNVPVLALAGNQDLICPPEAVYETAKLLPRHVVTYKLLGKPGGPHYGHYDIVGSRMAINEVYPCIIEFLCQHDGISQGS